MVKLKIMDLKMILLLHVFLTACSCRSQVLPINTSLKDIPANAYVKDLNNEFASYVGMYTTTYQGNNITLYITKVENKLEKSSQKNYYLDVLDIKYIVKNASGNILQDTQNNNLPKIHLYSIGIRPYENSIHFFYSGTNCRAGWGKVILKKINATEISWEYIPNSTIIDSAQCPPATDTTIYLPETKDLIFTKQ
ncbi:DUF6705 family protein [Chryseobacterium camelliae]|uniref:DUF6705 family protein n=1 Tax=Chryseobacterium camelliae TaxID=1265445 RepID=UPI0012FD6967|nr:DUF6705 family protein [Chryseobacterium camelliae]